MASGRLVRVLGHLDAGQVTSEGASAAAGVPVLEKERAECSFDVREMQTMLHEVIQSQLESTPELFDYNAHDFSRMEVRERTMEKIHYCSNMMKMMKKSKVDREDEQRTRGRTGKGSKQEADMTEAFWKILGLYDPNWSTRIAVHYGLFGGAIYGQGTDEQRELYAEDIQTLRIVGCFAMTELGHGSFVRGIETTATYDIPTQQFIINTPTETATKWWIGGAAHTCTHSVVFAQLYIKGKNYGVHSFICQLRNKDGSTCEGIEIGDCGLKMGRQGVDNGWIKFHNVAVPRDNMLMRWAKVSPTGEYSKPPKAQLSYGALIAGRVSLISGSADIMKKALTIAVRYSAVRTQFPKKSDEDNDENTDAIHPKESGEEQILNYQSHQYRLMPLLAGTYAFHFAAMQINATYDDMMADIESEALENLPETHATAAGLKAFTTWWAQKGLEQCRQCLGGHGYSAYSALPGMLSDFGVMVTWEGDNTVMAQQNARFLVKKYREAKGGKRLTGFMKYLSDYIHGNTPNISLSIYRMEDLYDPQTQLEIHKKWAAALIVRACDRLDTESWNDCMMDLIQASEAHCYYYVLSCFADRIKNIADINIGRAMKRLADLFALENMEQHLGNLLREAVLHPSHAKLIQVAKMRVIASVRKEAVPLVDAFNYPDFMLSPLGRYDGDIYTHYFEMVRRAPNSQGIAPYFKKFISPLING
eukprot:CAMPEP_0177643802 /NCGR_PEP_ID=MMETSP0447-20121125/8342_1 /TAXON_ID=0 /ORGANISM="Stygamoeba regulata, Strain BSH-02190019" /LENGTH=702 /DNA_ID=CAMNT_0019146107 /DNA_START=165 /DNA_END=2273 /DNA_ORIENTATION=+